MHVGNQVSCECQVVLAEIYSQLCQVSFVIHCERVRTVAMATVISQHVCHLGCHLEFFKNFIFSKSAQRIFLNKWKKWI